MLDPPNCHTKRFAFHLFFLFFFYFFPTNFQSTCTKITSQGLLTVCHTYGFLRGGRQARRSRLYQTAPSPHKRRCSAQDAPAAVRASSINHGAIGASSTRTAPSTAETRPSSAPRRTPAKCSGLAWRTANPQPGTPGTRF